MTTTKLHRSPALAAIVGLLAFVLVLVGGGIAHAQTTYTNTIGTVYNVPAGYTTAYTNNGVYYDPSTGWYYDAVTGQYSTTVPSGPAPLSTTGAYTVPAGYTLSSYGTYYNPSTGLYYDPATGFYSSMAPVGPIYPETATTPALTANPGLPNTGAGGEAPQTIAILGATALLALAGIAIFSSKIPLAV